MNPLTPAQTHQVVGGIQRPTPATDINHTPAAFGPLLQPQNTVAVAISAPELAHAMQYTPTHPNGIAIPLHRFDENFLAPSDSLSEDTPLFAGINDQGGIV
jgi:hypothetical protein